MISDDMALVREYAQSNSEQAFAKLVSRHINLVYSVALRQVRDPHLAEEITQSVFIILAGKAKSLSPKTILSGWLCRTARYVSANTLSIQRRRQFREQEAHMESILSEPEPGVWNQIAPLLDEALNCLGEKEHGAVVLRFFDGKELKHVGAAMGTTEDGARMRMNRGLEKLREFFTKKGVSLSTVAIAGAVSANSVQAAPAGLAAAITAAALSGTALAAGAAVATTATHTIFMSIFSIKTFTAAVGAALLAGTGIYLVQQRQIERLKADNQDLVAQRQQSAAEQEAASRTAQGAKEELARLQKDNAELLRLRNEVGQLRQEHDAAQQRANQHADAERSAANPGRYVSKDQLIFAGYATPESALESMTWAVMKGSFDQFNASIDPTILADQSRVKPSREDFERQKEIIATGFKGMQIVARKSAAGGRVELKVKVDFDSPTSRIEDPASFTIETMVKVGDEWKSRFLPRRWQPEWDQDGQVQLLAQ
jgi:RNA polymerase sigma factor (sigma-70 family)